jgi:hypothetical protein
MKKVSVLRKKANSRVLLSCLDPCKFGKEFVICGGRLLEILETMVGSSSTPNTETAIVDWLNAQGVSGPIEPPKKID